MVNSNCNLMHLSKFVEGLLIALVFYIHDGIQTQELCVQNLVVTLDRSGKIRSGGLTMTATLSLPTCPNPACEQPHVIRNGSSKGRRRYHCRGCGRFFGETAGTPMYRLHTPVAEVAQALLVVMRRGSLRAAEEITGYKYETIGEWLRR